MTTTDKLKICCTISAKEQSITKYLPQTLEAKVTNLVKSKVSKTIAGINLITVTLKVKI